MYSNTPHSAAMDLLNHMLVMKASDRFDVHKTLSHAFLSNNTVLQVLLRKVILQLSEVIDILLLC